MNSGWRVRAGELLRALERAVARVCALVGDDSRTFGPPRRCFESARAWIAETGRGADEVKVGIFEEEALPRALPVKKCAEFGEVFEINGRSMDQFVCRIPGGRVTGKQGIVLTPEDGILGDISYEFATSPERHSIYRRFNLPPVEKKGGTIAVLHSPGPDNYYHWTFEVLPQFDLIKRSGFGFDQIYVRSALPFQRDSLELAGIQKEQVYLAADGVHLEVENLVVPSVPSRNGNVAPWTCDFLRRLTAEVDALPGAARRIYVVRDDPKRRGVENHAEVTGFLERHGFATVRLEELSFVEQVGYFKGAEIVVAPHGAGLAGTVYCQPGTQVLELFSPAYVNPIYWKIANLCGLRYRYLVGEEIAPGQAGGDSVVNAPIKVNLERLEKEFRLAERECRDGEA